MSAKKKLVFECRNCGCHVLSKDEIKHTTMCRGESDLVGFEIVSLKPAGRFFASVQHLDGFEKYLPGETTGWQKYHTVFMSRQTIDLWGVQPRQPCFLDVGGEKTLVVVWQCNELTILRIASPLAPKERIVELRPVFEYTPVNRLELKTTDGNQKIDRPFLNFLEVYLASSFLSEGCPITLRYFGKKLTFSPVTPISIAVNNLSLDEGEKKPNVMSVAPSCSILVTGPELSKVATTKRTDPFGAIGGCTLVKNLLRRLVLEPHKSKTDLCSILLWGLPGSGKTLLLNALQQLLGAAAIKVNTLDELVEKSSIFAANTILLVDVSIYPKEHKAYGILTDLMSNGQIGCVILTARSADDVDMGVRIRFPREVEVPVPNEAERVDILRILTGADEAVVLGVAKVTHGFTGNDLASVVRLAALEEGELTVRLEKAHRVVRPTGIRQFILEVPNVRFANIGGNEELKSEIQQAVIWPQTRPELFAAFGIEPPAGILLYGPPGCSKTLIARALANESGKNFLAIKGPELFNKWVGESEKAVRDLFARARQVAPTIIFFDEIDAVGQARGASGSTVGDRVLAQLLTELDGLEKQSGVILLAATNRPDQLDSALLRPGRLDRAIYVGLPDMQTRKDIFEINVSKMKTNGVLDKTLNIPSLVLKLEGYSGAEIVAVCRTAAMKAMREDHDNKIVEMRHFEEAMRAVVARTDKKLLDIYERFKLGNGL
ncbi:unnamed protein product, partial [Mesorhabditis spiculigera]